MHIELSEIRDQLLESSRIKKETAETQVEAIGQAARLFIQVLQSGGKILFCGNGGSAADSQHIAAELVGRFGKDRAALPAVALTTDTSILSSVANDYGYERVFQRQVEALGRPGDLLVGISTSGNSGNVVNAMEAARKMKMAIVVFTNASGGKMAGMADVAIRIPAENTARVQEGHITVGHILCDLVERKLFPGTGSRER
jgi:D-sedoheptulose 7-phosphate isomerase